MAWLKVLGTGYRVQGFRMINAWWVEFRIESLRYRVQGLGFRV
jgi:hypothetical protein